jgi:cytochrome c oxidase assembly protein subunit 15
MILIVLSGTAVRLTGSGLGCPDWPTCFHGRVTGSWSIHPLIEYGNRMITAALIVVTAVTFVAALLRVPRRRDLIALTAMLILSILVDAGIGALVVYSKLNPWLVAVHLLVSLAIVVVAAVLYHRSKYVYGPGARRDVRDPHFLRIARLLWIPFAVLLVTGTATTGSSPQSGASIGQAVAPRMPFTLADAAWVHSVAAVLFIGLVTGLLLSVWQSGAPRALQLGVRRLVVISLLQAAVGVTQYLTHLPAVLVELHILGALSLTIGVTQFHLRQCAHDREPGTEKGRTTEMARGS